MIKTFSSRAGMRLLSAALLAVFFVAVPGSQSFAANIIVVNIDGPGEGFNDPTPAAPVGGNTGTTLGAQRLIAFRHAAELWGATLDSLVTIVVNASFDPLAPNVLGSAGATAVFAFDNVSDSVGLGPGFYPGFEFPDTWYGSALGDKRTGVDLAPLFGGPPDFPDIRARFSSNFNFYLG